MPASWDRDTSSKPLSTSRHNWCFGTKYIDQKSCINWFHREVLFEKKRGEPHVMYRSWFPKQYRPCFPWNTGCLIGVFIMVSYMIPQWLGRVSRPLYTANNQSFSSVLMSVFQGSINKPVPNPAHLQYPFAWLDLDLVFLFKGEDPEKVP